NEREGKGMKGNIPPTSSAPLSCLPGRAASAARAGAQVVFPSALTAALDPGSPLRSAREGRRGGLPLKGKEKERKGRKGKEKEPPHRLRAECNTARKVLHTVAQVAGTTGTPPKNLRKPHSAPPSGRGPRPVPCCAQTI